MRQDSREKWYRLENSRPVTLIGAPDWCVKRTLQRYRFFGTYRSVIVPSTISAAKLKVSDSVGCG